MSTSSPLTALSSPSSFHTAIVSPLESRTTPGNEQTPGQVVYRQARELPRELKAHCQIHLEEQLYGVAISLLHSLLASGLSQRNGSNGAVYSPPPTHLALLNTIIVHPSHTTRATTAERLVVPSQTLDYLRTLLVIVGPLNADLRTAFQFKSGRINHTHNGGSSEDEDIDDDKIKSKIADDNSIWNRGKDFWGVVGWAFNCSVAYPHRWRYWKIWLEYMLDVLEADWGERERIDTEASERAGGEGPSESAYQQRSILMMYIKHETGRLRGLKWIMRALFADGDKLSLSYFAEVFEKETRGLPTEDKKRKRDAILDLENDQYGDYYDDEEELLDSLSEPPTPQKPGKSSKSDETAPNGWAESIPLRLRLFKLLSAAAARLPGEFVQLDELYDSFVSSIQSLPLPLFQLFISRHSSPLIEASNIEVLGRLLDFLLPSSSRQPGSVDPAARDRFVVSGDILKYCYLPYPANTVSLDDNAKLSLILENALKIVPSELLSLTPGLRQAAEKGINARDAKAKKKTPRGRQKDDVTDDFAKEVLTNSGERILAYVDFLEVAA